MKKYYKGWCTLPIEDYVRATDKAVCFTVAGGATTANDTNMWVPRAILKVSEPNEYGNADVYLPMWFVAKNGLFKAVERIREIDFDEVVEL
jgi:hypothetical protein